MKVAIVVKGFPVVTETFILNQITGLIDRNIHVDIYAFHRSQYSSNYHEIIKRYNLIDRTIYLNEIPHKKLTRLGILIKLLFTCRSIKSLKNIIRSCNVFRYGRMALSLYLSTMIYKLQDSPEYDIIHCQFGTVAPQILLLKEIGAIGGKIVTSFRGYDATLYLKNNPGGYGNLFEKGDLFLPVSKSLKQILINMTENKDKIKVLYSGIDTKKFNYTKRKFSDNGIVYCTTIARLTEKKGIFYGIKAVQKVLRYGYNVQYTIVGEGAFQPLIEKYIDANNLNQYVRLTGWKTHEEIKVLLTNSHFLIAPSITSNDGDREGIPNVLKEAMATGVPVVTTNHSGIPELVENGVSGFVVPEKDVDALADRIIYLINHPEDCERVSCEGRKKIVSDFDIDKLNDQLIKYYMLLVN